MKTIKYFVAFLSAALLFSACEPEQGLSQQNKDKEKPSVSLVLNEANDVTLSFDIVASDNAAQYAYAVYPGSDNEAPSAYDILLQETFAPAAGAYNAKIGDDASATASVTVDCSGFAAETYQVFAAAITETGLIGEVAVLDVTMNDTTAPAPVAMEDDANVVALQFNEAVVRGNGKAYVSIIAWGVSAYYVIDQEIPAENITVEGNVVTIVCPEAGNGAMYVVSYEAGLVTDLSGNKCTAYTSDYSKGGIVWQTENVNIPITAADFVEPEEGTDWGAEGASLTLKFPVQVMDAGLTNPIQVLYKEDAGNSQLNAEYVLAEDFQTLTIYIPRMPEGEFDVQIAEGAFYDIWDNVTSAFVPTEYRYSNFLADPVVGGRMTISYIYPDENGNAVASTFDAYLNVMDRNTVILQADWFEGFGGWAHPMLVGTVNYNTHEIVFGGNFYYSDGNVYAGAFGELFYYYDQEQTMGLLFMGGGEDGLQPVVMKFGEDGYVTSMSSCGYAIVSLTDGSMLGVFGMTEDASEVSYVEASQTAASAPRLSKYSEIQLKR